MNNKISIMSDAIEMKSNDDVNHMQIYQLSKQNYFENWSDLKKIILHYQNMTLYMYVHLFFIIIKGHEFTSILFCTSYLSF